MTFDQTLQIIFGAGLVALGWFFRIVYAATKELEKDITKLQVHVAENYIPKTDFNRLADELKTMLRDISDKLDTKVDK